MTSIPRLATTALVLAALSPLGAAVAADQPTEPPVVDHGVCQTVSWTKYDVSSPTLGVRAVTKTVRSCADGFVVVTREKSPWLLAGVPER